MANNFITLEEASSRICESIKKSAEEYQKQTSCSDAEMQRLEIAIATGIAPSFDPKEGE